MKAHRQAAVTPAENRLLVACLVLVPALSGSERGALVPGLKLSDVLALLILAAVLAKWMGKWVLVDRLGVAVAAYAGFFLLLTMINYVERPELPASSFVGEIAAVPQYLLLYLLANWTAQCTRSSAIALFMTSLPVAAVVAVIALMQLFDFGPTRELIAAFTANPQIASPEDWKVYRASGVFPSWHALGLYLAIHVALAGALLILGDLKKHEVRRVSLLVAICAMGLLAAVTATPILIAALIVLWLSARTFRFRYALSAALLCALAYVLTPFGGLIRERLVLQSSASGETPQTLEFRVQIWTRDYLPILREHPITGYGPFDPAALGVFEFTESMYVTVGMAGGAVLLGAFAVFLVSAYARMLRVWRDNLDQEVNLSVQARCLALVVLSIALAQFLHPYLDDAGGSPLLFMLLGWTSGYSLSGPRAEGPHYADTRLSTGRS